MALNKPLRQKIMTRCGETREPPEETENCGQALWDGIEARQYNFT